MLSSLKLSELIRKPHFSYIAIYVGAFIAITIPIAVMYWRLGSIYAWPEALGSAVIILIPYFFIPRRFRWTVLIPVWLVSISLLINIWYSRFFFDLIPFEDYLSFRGCDSLVINAAFSKMRLIDATMILPAAAFTITYILLLRRGDKTKNIRWRKRLMALLGSLILFAGTECYALANNKFLRYNTTSLFHKVKVRYWALPTVAEYEKFNSYGFVGYFVKNSCQNIIHKLAPREATDAEFAILKAYKDHHDRLVSPPNPLFAENRDKNLVVIVVESLMSKTVEYEHDGLVLMPNLNKLIEADGTIACLECVPQQQNGISSDGQLMINTGIYPSTECTTVLSYAYNDFPALPKMWPNREAIEIICERPSMYNHAETNKSYGYDSLISYICIEAGKKGIIYDRMLADTAVVELASLQQPYVAFLTTFSMHTPFLDSNVKMPKWIKNIPDISEEARNYLSMAHEFDKTLGSFLERLPNKENTVVVLASDHDFPLDSFTAPTGNNRIVFVAANTGLTQRIEHPIGQVDIFPTIMEIMGNGDHPSGAMGFSILNPNHQGAIDRNGAIHGDITNPDFLYLLENSSNVANIMLRTDTYLFDVQ